MHKPLLHIPIRFMYVMIDMKGLRAEPTSLLAQAGIQLSQEQEDEMLACRRTALQGFGALVVERESVWAQLQVCTSLFSCLPCQLTLCSPSLAHVGQGTRDAMIRWGMGISPTAAVHGLITPRSTSILLCGTSCAFREVNDYLSRADSDFVHNSFVVF